MKDDKNYIINGLSFDATKLIDNLFDTKKKDESLSIFHKLDTNVKINIKKMHIDKINYINNLNGILIFKHGAFLLLAILTGDL